MRKWRDCGIHAAFFHGAHEVQGVGGGGDENGGPVVLQHRELVVDVQRVFGDDGGFDKFGAQHVACGIGINRTAEGDLDDIVGGDAAGDKLARDEAAPLGEVVARVPDHKRLAFRAKGGVKPDDFTQWKRKHAVRKARHHVFGCGEGKRREVGQRFETGIGESLAVAADVAAEPHEEGLKALELELLQLRRVASFRNGDQKCSCECDAWDVVHRATAPVVAEARGSDFQSSWSPLPR